MKNQNAMQAALSVSLAQMLGVDVSVLKGALELASQNRKAKEAQPHRTLSEHKADRSARFAVYVAKAFSDLGYADCQPNVTIKTASKWIAEGFVPMKGQKAVRFSRKGNGWTAKQGANKGLPLFHKSQVQAVNAGNVITL